MSYLAWLNLNFLNIFHRRNFLEIELFCLNIFIILNILVVAMYGKNYNLPISGHAKLDLYLFYTINVIIMNL